jgi:hypothetical protein
MVKSKLVRASAVAVASVGLLTAVSGIAGASASNGSISTTGFQSVNVNVAKNTSHVHVDNHTNLLTGNLTLQSAHTGSASSTQNTTVAGGAGTGAATNGNNTSMGVAVTNTTPVAPMNSGMSSSSGSIDTTGANSVNKNISVNTSDTHVTNTTNVAALNFTAQQSTTGDATVSQNTTVTGGGATTGAATNTNSTTTTIMVTNQ